MYKLLLAISLICFIASPAHGEDNECMNANALLKAFNKAYGETIVAAGKQSEGRGVLVITASPKGTFSVITISPAGEACVINSGYNFALTTSPSGTDT